VITDPPGNNNGFTTLIDRTGSIDSILLGTSNDTSRFIDFQVINRNVDSIRIAFQYAGTSQPSFALFSLRDNGGHFYRFGESFTASPNFVSVDTLFGLDTIRNNMTTEISCKGNPANNIWFAVKDLK